MAHRVNTAVVFCSDFRQNKRVLAHCEKEYGDFDTLSFPGACLALLDNESAKPVLNWIKTLYHLHHFTRLVFVDHSDCGAYKIAYQRELAQGSAEEEIRLHNENFARVSQLIKNDPILQQLELEFALYRLPEHRLQTLPFPYSLPGLAATT